MYRPKSLPPKTDADSLAAYVSDELQSVSQSQFDPVDFVQLNVLYVAPKKPRAGMVIYADGTSFNPGSGEGVYRRSVAGSWVFLG